MFEHYLKLFHLDWIDLWMVEAIGIMAGALLLGLVFCKVADCLEKINQ